MRRFCETVVLLVATLVTACGGGGGSGGSSLFGDGSGSSSGSGSGGSSTSSGSGTSNVTTSSAGSVVMTLSSATISASTPGTVTALVKDSSGQPIANTIVTFAVANGTATVSPTRVTTDASGIAATALQPVSGAVGADYVTASADVSSSSLTSRVVFTVSSVSVTLSSITASPSSVPAYGASVIDVGVAGASAASPVTVTFSSTCASSGKAVLSPSSVTVTGATASTTYQDKACSSVDRVSAVINGTAQQRQVDLTVAAPTAQSLEFVSASPDTICLAGSGCSASSVVSFMLKDQFGLAVAGRDVTFNLDVPNVADLSFMSAKTDNSGIAQVSVSARAVPTPVRVRATVVVDSSTTLSTVSNVLSINAGLPTSRAFSFSASPYNVDGWSKDGTESTIRLQLNDRFGNAVPDGTAINIVSEGASVIPASCQTVSGVCSVKFVSSNSRPSDGRVTVVAYAQGEESFDDADGNNLYSAGEAFVDLGPVFVDKDEDDMQDTGEYLVGTAANGAWSSNVYVRASRVFILSNSSIAPRLGVPVGGSCDNLKTAPTFNQFSFTPTVGVSSCRVTQSICVRDSNADADSKGGNPIPSGSTLTVSTNAKGVTASVDNSPLPSTATSPTLHQVTVQLSDCSKAVEAAGSLDLSITMPDGTKYTTQIGTIQ